MLRFRRKTKSNRAFMVGATVVLVIVVLGALKLLFPHIVGNMLATLTRPLWEARVHLASEALLVNAFQSKVTLVRENDELRQALRDAQLKLLDRRVLVQENRELKQLLGTGTTTTDALPAAVVSRPNATPYDTLIIARGDRDGVRVGNAVLVGESILVGTIEEVFTDTARVRLFSSHGLETDVVLSDSEVVTTARGIGGGNFTIRIPSDIEVAEYAPVTLSGRTTRILGFVSSRESAPGDVFQTIRFRTPVNLSTIRWVLVELRSPRL